MRTCFSYDLLLVLIRQWPKALGLRVSLDATTALFAPVAIALAGAFNQPPEPYAITVAAAAVTSFLTPLGHHGNLLVYGPGGYQITDFIRVGALLPASDFALELTFGQGFGGEMTVAESSAYLRKRSKGFATRSPRRWRMVRSTSRRSWLPHLLLASIVQSISLARRNSPSDILRLYLSEGFLQVEDLEHV